MIIYSLSQVFLLVKNHLSKDKLLIIPLNPEKAFKYVILHFKNGL